MSNARSPREVCSTTIGTRGLMAAQSSDRLDAAFRSEGRSPIREGARQRDPFDEVLVRPQRSRLMAKPDHRSEILTVGHSNHEEGEFIELLHGAGVELIADVR